MFVAWVVFHVLICVTLVLVVLMQSSKGEGLAGSAFGGGGGGLGGAVFGGRGAASFLSKSTSYLAVIFMLNCGALAFMSSSSRRAASGPGDEVGTSVVTEQAQREMEQARQQQQQQQQQLLDDSTAPFQVTPTDQAPPAPSDPSGQ